MKIYNEIISIIKGALMGVGIGYIIAMCFSLSIKDGVFYPAPLEVLDSMDNINAALMLAGYSALVGATFSGLRFVWNIERWSLLKSSLVYFTVNLVVMTFSGYKMYWFSHNLKSYIFYLGMYIFIFAVIWIICYNLAKKSANELNEKLGEIKK